MLRKSTVDMIKREGWIWTAILAMPVTLLIFANLWTYRISPPKFRYENYKSIDLGLTALANYRLGKYQEAESGFLAATMIQPDRSELWYDLGNTFFKEGKYRQAVSAFVRVLELNPNDRDAKSNLELACAKLYPPQDKIASLGNSLP